MCTKLALAVPTVIFTICLSSHDIMHKRGDCSDTSLTHCTRHGSNGHLMVRKAHRHGAQHTAHGKLGSVHKKTKPPIVVADQTEMLTTYIVKHQRVSHSGGTCAGGGMRCGPRSIFVWYNAADAAGNADGLKPTKHDSISKRIGTALLKLLAHGVCYVPNGTARVPTQEHSPGPETASPSRRRRLDSSLSTTRT